jgi:putative pyruvate formate lyase activating enzyme
MMALEPAYLSLLRSGELQKRAEKAFRRLECCDICPRQCSVNRCHSAEGAACHTGLRAVVSGCTPHFGEEAPLVGTGGSGTIFFSWCNLKCQYCQNYGISQLGEGHEVEPEELAAMMLQLQEMGCHNINFVSPTHVVPQILAAVWMAARAGLHLPLVYNTGGYDALETLLLLDGVFDIYMPDMKYADEPTARRLSKVNDYPAINRAAVAEMHRQVGDLCLDELGIAVRGLLVRHLVLPAGLAGTGEIVRFLAEEISPNTYLNIMDQYRPCYKASELSDLDRPVTSAEYAAAVRLAHEAGLTHLDHRQARFLPWI